MLALRRYVIETPVSSSSQVFPWTEMVTGRERRKRVIPCVQLTQLQPWRSPESRSGERHHEISNKHTGLHYTFVGYFSRHFGVKKSSDSVRRRTDVNAD